MGSPNLPHMHTTYLLTLPVSAPEPPAQALSLLPHLPDNNAAETAHNRHREWRPIPFIALSASSRGFS